MFKSVNAYHAYRYVSPKYLFMLKLDIAQQVAGDAIQVLHPIAAAPITQTEGGNGQERRKQNHHAGH